MYNKKWLSYDTIGKNLLPERTITKKLVSHNWGNKKKLVCEPTIRYKKLMPKNTTKNLCLNRNGNSEVLSKMTKK